MIYKLVFNDEIRRVKCHAKTLQGLKELIRTRLKSKLPEPFYLEYNDSFGDKEYLQTQEDFDKLQKDHQDKNSVKVYIVADLNQSIMTMTTYQLTEVFEDQDDVDYDALALKKEIQKPKAEKIHCTIIPDILEDIKKNIENQKKDEDLVQETTVSEEEENEEIVQKIEKSQEIEQKIEEPQDQEIKEICQKVETPSEEEVEEKVVHVGYICDGCDGPIVGACYMCSVCKNFDYCEKCEKKLKHPHPFLKLNTPDQRPHGIFLMINEEGQKPFVPGQKGQHAKSENIFAQAMRLFSGSQESKPEDDQGKLVIHSEKDKDAPKVIVKEDNTQHPHVKQLMDIFEIDKHQEEKVANWFTDQLSSRIEQTIHDLCIKFIDTMLKEIKSFE